MRCLYYRPRVENTNFRRNTIKQGSPCQVISRRKRMHLKLLEIYTWEHSSLWRCHRSPLPSLVLQIATLITDNNIKDVNFAYFNTKCQYLPPILIKQRLLDLCVGRVSQFSKYIVVPGKERGLFRNVENFCIFFLQRPLPAFSPSLENRATFCSSPLPKQTAKFPK